MHEAIEIDAGSHSGIPSQWLNWIGENKLLETDEAAVIDVLAANGFDRRDAEQQVKRAAQDQFLRGGNSLAQRLAKLESLLNVYSALWSASVSPPVVERRDRLSREEFLRSYYSVNRPVIMLDQMQDWKALSSWSPEYFKERYGNEQVEVMADRSSDPQYEIHSESHKRTVRLADFVDLVTSATETNDQYMVANNNALESSHMKQLLSDVIAFPEYLDSSRMDGNVFLWFGPAGTVTPLHHDVINILIAQVYGRKRFTLIPSFQTHLVYNRHAVYSEVDCDAADYNRFPLFRDAQRIEVTLEPGEVLFIPVGWWHHVRSLEASISVSFINFRFPNEYQWQHPDRNR